MRFIHRNPFLKVLMMAILALSLSSQAMAASVVQGYAVHRDGAFFGTTWHAGIMDQPSASASKPVTHIGGTNGDYRPKSGISSVGRDNVVAQARKLTTENIGYTAFAQIAYDPNSTNTWVSPSMVYSIRCDRVVEYCFEYCGYRIYGSDSRWDISRVSQANLDEHSVNYITPKSQAQSYMTKVQSTVP